MTEYISYDLVEWGHPFEERSNDLPAPAGSEVLIRVTAAGLCHSDLHVQKGFMDLGEEGRLTFAERGAQLPMTFGHEIAGLVEAMSGRTVKDVRVGQQVSGLPVDRLRHLRGLPQKAAKATVPRCGSSG